MSCITTETNIATAPTKLAHVPLTFEYKNILIKKVITTKFLGMHIDNNMCRFLGLTIGEPLLYDMWGPEKGRTGIVCSEVDVYV